MRLTALSEAVAEVGIRGLCEYFVWSKVFKRYFQGALKFVNIFRGGTCRALRPLGSGQSWPEGARNLIST